MEDICDGDWATRPTFSGCQADMFGPCCVIFFVGGLNVAVIKTGKTSPFRNTRLSYAPPVEGDTGKNSLQSGRNGFIFPQNSETTLFCRIVSSLDNSDWMQKGLKELLYYAGYSGKGNSKLAFLRTCIHVSIHVSIHSRNLLHSLYKPGIIFGNRITAVGRMYCPRGNLRFI